jgi:L-lactate dehydrogenase complex protein LldG
MSFDTDKARDEIFRRIRTAQNRSAPGAEDRAAAADYMARHPVGPQPPPYADARAQFVSMAERMSSTVESVGSVNDAPAEVARYLAAQGIAPNAVAWPALRELPWSTSALNVEFRPPRRDETQGADMVGITGAFCAIAETGTLVFLSGAATPTATALLADTHVAVLRADRIVSGMEEAFALVRGERGALPRAVNFISGPSRTGDIEQTIVLGAHGPFRVHILLLG